MYWQNAYMKYTNERSASYNFEMVLTATDFFYTRCCHNISHNILQENGTAWTIKREAVFGMSWIHASITGQRIKPGRWDWVHDSLHLYQGWQQHTGFLSAPPHSLTNSVPFVLSQLSVLLGHACRLGISGHWLLDSGMRGMGSSWLLETMCRVSQNCLSPTTIKTQSVNHILGHVCAQPPATNTCTHMHALIFYNVFSCEMWDTSYLHDTPPSCCTQIHHTVCFKEFQGFLKRLSK